ncbi:hypothetical protein DFJ58DRAFT_918321 [Suillus subalutaceus]|uniref:uncharacterized protein n=1 Tax=Suillus subalutaceus TaxID=48586 RepID=UPI001B866497|nr:uncharacterized protein DFJ58DRAFT_918321 [Suillus subalutaceus]KAG1830690.1 hypothetical protein DFJ58DRAFT_918321 [Suillus subalutaceus]
MTPNAYSTSSLAQRYWNGRVDRSRVREPSWLVSIIDEQQASRNYMIESADSKGQFLTVENGNIQLHSEDSHSVQVWKLTISDNWVNFQGVPPDGKEGKIIGVSTGASTLVYGDGILEDFQLESAANNTFRLHLDWDSVYNSMQIVRGPKYFWRDEGSLSSYVVSLDCVSASKVYSTALIRAMDDSMLVETWANYDLPLQLVALYQSVPLASDLSLVHVIQPTVASPARAVRMRSERSAQEAGIGRMRNRVVEEEGSDVVDLGEEESGSMDKLNFAWRSSMVTSSSVMLSRSPLALFLRAAGTYVETEDSETDISRLLDAVGDGADEF